jgi:uncharacterized protein
MLIELGLVFALGIVSSLHCVQMCGPLVLAFSLPLQGRRVARANLGYNAGRIATYTVLGAVAGALGSGIGLLGRLAGLASGARLFAGAAMIAAGILMVALGPGSALIAIDGQGPTARLRRFIGARLTAPTGKFALGLGLGFLPCGLVYAALLKAVETGDALHGALTMLAFGAGTAVTLFTLGVASSLIRLPRWSHRVAAACLVVTGIVLMWRGLFGKPVCHG